MSISRISTMLMRVELYLFVRVSVYWSVENIPLDTSESELGSFFKQFGTVLYAKICRDKVTKLPRGTGFVKFDSTETVDELLKTYGFTPSSRESRSVKDEDVSQTSHLTLHDRPLQISRAVTRKSLKE